jgi:predicted RNA-binding Zn-ribbon protein involved in translation (DUF1610 family)
MQVPSLTLSRVTSNLRHRPQFREASVTDLERFFRRLVANLAATDPARLHRPLELDQIQRDIIPYRANRRALELESSEDYEFILLRLCAGEGRLVRTEPEEVRERFAKEIRSPNPDLTVLHRFEQVLVTLEPVPLARALGPEPDPDLPYAPPPAPAALDLPMLDPLVDADAFVEEALPADVDTSLGEVSDLPPSGEPLCLYCGAALPGDREVRFCPHCGQRQAPPACPSCHSEVEPGWRHCVNCGTVLAER